LKPLRELKKDARLKIMGPDKAIAAYGYHAYDGVIKCKEFFGTVIFGYDEPGLMEHVSINPFEDKTPSWDVMCLVKDMFFYPVEMVVQLHPAESEYVHSVNGLENVLHLWRPKDGNWEMLNHPERWD
jgi:hypothetical protein